MTISQHTAAVTCVKWGGEGLIYTASQDKTIKVWNSSVSGFSIAKTNGYSTNAFNLGYTRENSSRSRSLGKLLAYDRGLGVAADREGYT